MNGYQGQIRARDSSNKKFLAGQDIIQLIKTQSINSDNIKYLKRIGIFAPQGTKVSINNTNDSAAGKIIQIGKTKIYQVEDVEIREFHFLQDSTPEVIIDYIIEY